MNGHDQPPPHWVGVGGSLDEVTRAARGTVYGPGRRTRAARRAAQLVVVLVVVLVVAGLAAATWLANLLGL